MNATYTRNPDLVVEWEGDRALLTNAATGRSFRVVSDVVRVLDGVGNGASLDDLRRPAEPPTAATVDRILGTLVEIEALVPRAPTGTRDRPLSSIERTLHVRTAQGYLTHSGRPDVPAPPADACAARPGGGETVQLPVSTDRLQATLSDVLDNRRSIRRYGRADMDLKRLSTFLWEAARVRSRIGAASLQATHRASPSAGARHSLEIFPICRAVTGLADGCYRYDPFRHELSVEAPWTDEVTSLCERVIVGPANLAGIPPVSLYLVSLPERVAWKYPGTALATIYRDAGCLMQTCYLVATALRLAPCAIAALDEPLSLPFPLLYSPAAVHVGSFVLGLQSLEGDNINLTL